MTIPHRKL